MSDSLHPPQPSRLFVGEWCFLLYTLPAALSKLKSVTLYDLEFSMTLEPDIAWRVHRVTLTMLPETKGRSLEGLNPEVPKQGLAARLSS